MFWVFFKKIQFLKIWFVKLLNLIFSFPSWLKLEICDALPILRRVCISSENGRRTISSCRQWRDTRWKIALKMNSTQGFSKKLTVVVSHSLVGIPPFLLILRRWKMVRFARNFVDSDSPIDISMASPLIWPV